jgi:8-oxo-dGTP diphosphatase
MKIGLISHVILLNKDNEVLIIKRSASEKVLPNYWDIPGGTVRDGEDPMKGAIRELYEETKIKANKFNLLHYTSNIDRKKDRQFVRIIFVGRVENSKVVINKKDHDDYRWVKLNKKEILKYKKVDYLPECLKLLTKEQIATFWTKSGATCLRRQETGSLKNF